MNGKHKHQLAIDLLITELCRIGGEIFTKAFVEKILRARGEKGYKNAEEELNMNSFLDSLLAGQIEGNEAAQFHSLIESVLILSKDKEEKL